MTINFFSPLLVILILTLSVKASMLFGKIQEQTTTTADSSVTSVFVDTAYAKNKSEQGQIAGQLAINESQQLDSKPLLINPPIRSFSEENAINEANVEPTVISKNTFSSMSSSELQLLKELSKRRQELDKIQENIDVRAQVLKATENKIDKKMLALKSLQAKVEEIIKQYNEKEQGKIMSLVKIYENMKPRDAAKIFDELEMPVLLEVVSRMKEIRVAPVIANMNPQKARELSIEFTKQKTIN